MLCTPCSGTWVLITVFCLLQHLPSRGSQSVLQTLINLASQPSCEVGGGCHAVQMRTLSCSGTVASLLVVKARGGDGPLTAEGRAVLHDSRDGQSLQRAAPQPCSSLLPAVVVSSQPRCPEAEGGVVLVGKDIQTVSLCPVGCALGVTHIPSVPLQSPRATLYTPSFTTGC